mgnify:FL=1
MFFKNNIENKETKKIIKIGALLIHAAKIDENYSIEEEEIIKQALIKIGADDKNIENLIQKAKEIEENSNQILDFTRETKTMDEKDKIKIIETLWRIIYSNNDMDIFESNLMRRLAGLLYIDSKTMGDIKEKIKKENIR